MFIISYEDIMLHIPELHTLQFQICIWSALLICILQYSAQFHQTFWSFLTYYTHLDNNYTHLVQVQVQSYIHHIEKMDIVILLQIYVDMYKYISLKCHSRKTTIEVKTTGYFILQSAPTHLQRLNSYYTLI